MDLNCLYARHQISLMMAESAPASERARYHLTDASGYARRIAALRRSLGATSASLHAAK